MKEGCHMAKRRDPAQRQSHDTIPTSTVPNADDVARRAYELYEARGSEPGADLDDW